MAVLIRQIGIQSQFQLQPWRFRHHGDMSGLSLLHTVCLFSTVQIDYSVVLHQLQTV